MLWEKEVHSKDSIYVNLLANIEHSRHKNRIHRKKCNEFSQKVRMEGNHKYSNKDFKGALVKYNRSICLAEDGSEELSLAYGNRSQCFLKLQLYTCCLVDIDLAKSTGYPMNLISKLEKRKLECFKELNLEENSTDTKPVFPLESNNLINTDADLIEIHRDNVYGRFAKSKRDIDIGETVIFEEAYIRTINDDECNECTYCGSKQTNFIPCTNCADAMYCSKKCSKNNFHDIECDMMIGTMEDTDWLAFILRSVVIGISTFETITDMMEFVEKSRSNNQEEVNEYSESRKSKYGAFIKLASVATHQRIVDLREKAFFIFDTIMTSKLAYKFETISAQRFLVHLIVQHGIILHTNSFSFEDDRTVTRELCLLTSMINHSCLPNICKLSNGNLTICRAILPIKRDEQLFITYIDGQLFGMSEKQRNDQLEESYGFRCKCRLCTVGAIQGVVLENDPSFMYVSQNAILYDDQCDKVILQRMKERCVEFLLQHLDMVGSEEVTYITDTLTAIFSKELNMMNSTT